MAVLVRAVVVAVIFSVVLFSRRTDYASPDIGGGLLMLAALTVVPAAWACWDGFRAAAFAPLLVRWLLVGLGVGVAVAVVELTVGWGGGNEPGDLARALRQLVFAGAGVAISASIGAILGYAMGAGRRQAPAAPAAR